MKNSDKQCMGKRATAVLLTVILTLTALTAVIVPYINTVDAADVPGTTAYYDARWAEAKAKVGNLPVGTAYTDYQGNAAVTTNEGPWMLDNLQARVNAGTLSAPWNGTSISTAEYNALESVGVVYVNGTSGTAKKVYTAEELMYCVQKRLSFQLQNDIDLNGYNGKDWKTPVWGTAQYVADGNGYTVYNYYHNGQNSNLGNGQSFFGTQQHIRIMDFRISNSYLVNTDFIYSSMFLTIPQDTAIYNSTAKITDCAVENSMIRCAGRGAFMSTGIGVKAITGSYVRNCVIYGTNHIASIAAFGGVYGDVENCYATDTTVISAGEHSGGLISCSSVELIRNSFVSVEMYCNKQAGLIYSTGDSPETDIIRIENCFATGRLEGTDQLGGFIAGVRNNAAPKKTVITNCYSTAQVGLMSTATNIGGFIGNDAINSATVEMTNCYAAGEVGNINTVVDSNRIVDKTVGGFAGNDNGAKFIYDNCYYDKQATGMREWETGKTVDGGSGNKAELQGKLTTTTVKSGIGMTDTAFSTELNDGGTAFAQTANYYPELQVFKNPTTFTNTNWMTQTDLNDLVKANSKASVSTVHLSTWENDYSGTALPTTTYDTVRDVTIRFQLTSDSGISWERCGVTGSATLANGTGAKSGAFVIDGTDVLRDVFALANDNGVWMGHNPLPGVDWVRVTSTVGGQQANRALRICPRVGIEAGLSRTVGMNGYYDHADDMQMVYSTGARLTDTDTANDYTYGVFPDNPIADRQQNLLNLSAFANYGALVTKYNDNGQNNAFFNIGTAYMERTSADLTTGVKPSVTAASNKINAVIIKQITGENADGTLNYGTPIDLTQADEANRWNGIDAFYTDDIHRVFEVGYYWSLADGRYLYDSKRIEYPFNRAVHTVTIEAQNVNGTAIGDSVYLDAYNIAATDGTADPSMAAVFGTDTKASDILLSQPHGLPAATSWKLTDDPMVGLKIAFTYTNPDNSVQSTQEETIDINLLPQAAGETATIKVKAPYRMYTVDANGDTRWKAVLADKNYQVTLNASGEYKIAFDLKKADYETGVYIEDIDMDIDVTVIVDTPDPPVIDSNAFAIKKKLTAPAEEDELFVFKAEYRGNAEEAGTVQNIMYATIRINAGDSEASAVFTDVPSGWYTVTEIDANWRFEPDKDALENDNEGAMVDRTSGSVTYRVGAQT